MSVLPAKVELEQAAGSTSGGQGQLPSEKPQSHQQTTHEVRHRNLFVSSQDATSSSIHWAVKRQAPWPSSWQHQQSDFRFNMI